MERIVSKTKYSRKEHKKFYLFHLFHRTSSIYFMLVMVVLLAAMTAYNVYKGENVTFVLVMFGITCGMIPFLIINKINEVVKQETPERLKSTDTIEVTKHKITRSNDIISGKAVVGWNNLDCVCENDEFFYLYLANTSGLFIKKADIIEGSIEDFRELALNNLLPGKNGKVPYKRYGNVKKAYNKEMRIKKAQMKKQKKGNK